ncbi:TPA: hypothetical protein EYO77_14890 [Candidatus Poribacteria bacterium]|nr:hypothetical protein [Candidatus Poribacteria bacterium]HIM10163.1 hypothetical protein [Candidatus Poribacteria bacterium]HIN28810.1 hypothetical protein [Candidatus Poribacteria bacterium]
MPHAAAYNSTNGLPVGCRFLEDGDRISDIFSLGGCSAESRSWSDSSPSSYGKFSAGILLVAQ